VLATGGLGQIYLRTTNPVGSRGDGLAMAYRAGARVINTEYVQFHPTALAIAGAPRFLVSEAVRGEGAFLLSGAGERFTDELAPRDQVARAIFRENQDGRGPVTLDLRHLPPERIRTRFPRIVATCARYGIDLTREPVPVTPAAHYVMGGVATDLHARATLAGLYAAGEVAATGVHGANRLASNSLLEGLVFGARAAAAMADDATAPAPASAPAGPSGAVTGADRDEIRRRAWESLGVVRSREGLSGLERFLDSARSASQAAPRDRSAAETRNLADVARAMARCAVFREESRGAHFRSDFPERDDQRFRGHTLLEAGALHLTDVEQPLQVKV
jgi:L-aspartate oxidase